MEQGAPDAQQVLRLVLISGPIASGKTSLARELARMARQRGLFAASIDMDELVEMFSDWSDANERHRKLSCQLAAALIEKLFHWNVTLVTVAGSTLSRYEWDEVLGGLKVQPQTLLILLRVSFDEALRRARSDPERAATKDAGHLAWQFERLDWQAVREHDLDITTDGLAPNEVAGQIVKRLFD